MATVTFFIDNKEIHAEEGASILEAARDAGLYIPSLCYHPNLPSSRNTKASDFVYRGKEKIAGDQLNCEFEGCNLCLVEIEGQPELVPACDNIAKEGMKVFSETERVRVARQKKLMVILAKHPHACLICAQKEGCTREPCSTNVPVPERCCSKFGDCELEKVAEYLGIREDTPRYVPSNIEVSKDEPLLIRDYNLCIGCTRCVRACQELRGVKALGFVSLKGEVIVGSTAQSLKDSDCRFCLACVEVCPTGALMDKNLKPGEREISLVPCKYACPAGIDVPRYIHLVAQGRHDDAAAVIREKTPFPAVLGHACARPCEEKCRSREVNEPIAICALKRFAVDRDAKLWKNCLKKAPPTGKDVVVVGAGPAGLTAAYYLALLGHSVTVIETMPEIGGMMRYGIQEYRLPKSVLDEDLKDIFDLGIDVKTNTTVDLTSCFEELRDEGYDAIIVAIGLQKSRVLDVEGSNITSVLGGLDLLRDVRLGKEIKIKDHVSVVGGGAVATDVALTALRLGAKQVEMVCLEKFEEMPAFQWEIQQAIEEGVVVHNSWGITRILHEGGNVTGIELIRCLSAFDQNGRFNPSFDRAIRRTIDTKMVIFAIGQAPELKEPKDTSTIRLTQLETIAVNDLTMETSVKGVFACGDIVKGPSSLIDAVAQGRKVASTVDKYLGGNGDIDKTFLPATKSSPLLGIEKGFAYRTRVEMPALPIEKRIGNFAEIEVGLGDKAALGEAERCLRCDLRLTIRQPILPPERWVEFKTANIAEVPKTEGVFQLLDENKNVLLIKGSINLQEDLTEQIATNKKAKFFLFEEAKMFTMRESELLQQYMKKHGKLPEQNVGLEDDLY